MTRTFAPHPYQAQIIDHQCDVARGATWAGMGMGKTVSTLISLTHLDLVEPGPTLVLAPKRVAQSTWPDEVAKWEETRSMVVSVVLGEPADRRRALRKKADIYTTNYENLPWLIEHLGDAWPFTKVVADESTRLKSFRVGAAKVKKNGEPKRAPHAPVRSTALARVAHKKVRRFTELTGTPSPNGLEDLWGQAWFLDAGERLGRTHGSFVQRWFRPNHNGFGNAPMLFAQEQIEGKLRDICLSLDARDWFDLDEPIVRTIRVDLPRRARAIYEDMERHMFATIGETDIEAFGAAARTIKCLQLANGAAYLDEKAETFAEVHDVKIQALESIVAESGGVPLLVAYHFKSDLARLMKAFPKGRQLDAHPQTIRDWNAGKIPMLFAHPASAGHGLNLQDGGNILVYFAHWWNLEERMQILERIGPTRQKQAGHNRPVWVYNIVATDTVDELVIARTESKRDVQDLLMEAMKRRGKR